MDGERLKVARLERKPKDELKSILEDELGDSYPRSITDSLRNDFLRACYESISPSEDLLDRVQRHPNYSSDWGEKKTLATGLRMLLTERVNHPEFDGITGLTKPVLAEIIVAIHEADS